ncbi:MAG: DUF349 domain-containing protein [Bacteroidales bacterium]
MEEKNNSLIPEEENTRDDQNLNKPDEGSADQKTEETTSAPEVESVADEENDQQPPAGNSAGESPASDATEVSDSESETEENQPTETQAEGTVTAKASDAESGSEESAPEVENESEKSKPDETGVDLSDEEQTEEDEDDDSDDDSETEDEEPIPDLSNLNRAELVHLLEETVESGDYESIRNKVKQIQLAYLYLSKAENEADLENRLTKKDEEEEGQESTPAEDDIDARFQVARRIFREKREAWRAQQEEQLKKNLEQKLLILEELKALIDSNEPLKKIYDSFRELQERFKSIGPVPRNEARDLWATYHLHVERFFDRVKINRELRDLDMRKNLESKIELCEKAEELILEKSIIRSFKTLQQLHDKWREIGPVPEENREEIWERFKAATEKINQRRKEYYNQLKEQQEANLAAKTILCEKAEEILSQPNETINQWNKRTEEVTNLLAEWKKLGPAPRKVNDEIWERFRGSLNEFFTRKKEFFKKIREEQQNNYHLKVDLCIQAEALKDSTDWKKAANELIRLQKEWKKIGPAPRRVSDKVWKRFRAACDEFFDRKAEYFKNIKEHESENLKAKEALLEELKKMEFGENREENLEKLKAVQRKWMEIGHVPFAEKDRLNKDFRQTLDKHFEKLRIDKIEMQAMEFKDKFSDITDKPNADRIIRSELNNLYTRKKKLEDDVKVWENNIGFLAKSKTADLLKAEFEKKITRVKEQIRLIDEKIEFLRKERNS